MRPRRARLRAAGGHRRALLALVEMEQRKRSIAREPRDGELFALSGARLALEHGEHLARLLNAA